jgi:diaminopimelate decarboxylase
VFRDGVAGIARTHLAFAIKANPNLAVLRLLANEGFGADVVSGGELARALAAGMAAKDIVFSGVGKTRAELDQALERRHRPVQPRAGGRRRRPVQLAAARGCAPPPRCGSIPMSMPAPTRRSRPASAENKFGLPIDEAPAIFDRLAPLPGLNLRGVAVHIGSQLQSLAPLEARVRARRRLVAQLRAAGHTITHVDLGGGLGVPTARATIRPPGRIRRDGRARDQRAGMSN